MKLATIEKIHSIQPHPNPEVINLEVGKVKAWPVVVKKGEFKDGDLVVFIQVDSIVPSSNPYFSFMERMKYKVWNARFKGAPSQGLVCPVSILPNAHCDICKGCDVTQLLGIIKYEKPIDASIAGDTIGHFPTNLVPMTDELNLLSYPEVLNEFNGKACYITVKCDGSSCTIIYQGGKIRVCSRRLEQKEGTGFWKIVENVGLIENLFSIDQNIAIQAEACGGKIQKNKMDLIKPSLFIFDIRDLNTGEWYSWPHLKKASDCLNVPTAPIVENGFIFTNNWTIDRLQEIANNVKYTQRNGEEKSGEGIVLRPVAPCWSETLGRKLSVKILNVDYKL